LMIGSQQAAKAAPEPHGQIWLFSVIECFGFFALEEPYIYSITR